MSGPSLLAFVMAGGEGSRRQPLNAERTNSSEPFVAYCRMVDPALSDQIDPGIYSIYPLAVDADEHGHIRGILEMPAEPLAMPGRSGHACDIGRDRQRHQVTESGTVVMHRGIPRGAARIADGVS